MILLVDKGRDYRRWRHSNEEKIYLASRGLQHVLSSNVSAVGISDDDLIIRFHNGSLYRYDNMASRFRDIMTSNSKGKWVWRHLRRAGVPYQKIGSLPMKDDLKLDDDEMLEIGNRFMTMQDLPQFLTLDLVNFKLLDNNMLINKIPVMGQITS